MAPPTRWGAGGYLRLSVLWFAVNMLWGALLMIVIPSQTVALAPHDPARAQGLLLGVGAVPALAVPLLIGPLSDRCMSRWGRRRPFIAAGGALALASLAACWLAWRSGPFGAALVAYLLLQTGVNMAIGAYSGLIPDLVPEEHRGTASGWMAAMSQTGTLLGVVVAALLVRAGHVDAVYLLVGAGWLAALAATLLGVPEQPRALAPPPLALGALLRGLWIDPRRHPDFAWVWVTRALVTMGLWTVQEYIQLYLVDVAGVPFRNKEAAAGGILVLGLLSAAVAAPLAARWSDRVGRKHVVYVSNAGAALCCLAFPFAGAPGAAVALGILFGVAYGGYYSVDWALGCDVLPNPDDAAKDLAVWHIAFVLPQSVALPIAGWMLGLYGHGLVREPTGELHARYAHGGYVALFGLAAFYMIMGAILLRNVRRAR